MMTQTKHTPGPWYLATTEDNGARYFIYDGQTVQALEIAQIDRHNDLLPSTARANATLIAAAPDLLEALKEVVKWIAIRHDIPTTPIKDISDQKPFVQQAMRAIAKAEGR